MCFGGSDSNKLLQEQQEQREKLITQGLGQINKSFAGFDQPFYNRLQGSFLANALPQAEEQYRQTRSQLGYNLAGQGLLNSSSAVNLGASLERQKAQQVSNVANQSTQAVQELQRQIQGNKSNIISQLELSADPTAAAQQATASASGFAAPNILQPLGNLFQNWSSIYLARQYANASQQPSGIQYGSKTGFLPPNTPASAYTVK